MAVSLKAASSMVAMHGKGQTRCYNTRGVVIAILVGRVELADAQEQQSDKSRQDYGPIARVDYLPN